jgi:amino acid transporter
MGRLVSLSPFGRTLVSAAVILLLTIANSAGLRFGKTIQNVFALAKVASTGSIIICGTRRSRRILPF